MPPNSFCEWAAGRNAPQHLTQRKPRPVFALQLETDDEYESDVLKITYPRTGRTRHPHGKKVRFRDDAHRVEEREPFIQPSLDSDTDASSTVVEANSSDEEESTDEDLVLDCPCTNCAATRRMLKKTNQAKGKSKKHQVDSSTHGSKNDAAAVHARHKEKKAKEAEALSSRGRGSKRRTKQKVRKVYKKSSGHVETNESSTGSETATEDGTGEETESDSEAESQSGSERVSHKKRGRKKGKGHGSRQHGNRGRDGRSRKSKHGEKRSQRHRQDSRNRSRDRNSNRGDHNEKHGWQDSHRRDTREKEEAPQQDISSEDIIPRRADEINTTRTKEFDTEARTKLGEPTQYPPQNLRYPPQQANFLMPPHPRVLQVEHAVELPNDPRPNAFFDGVHGIMRVYHGPHYGNAYGQLYPNAPYLLGFSLSPEDSLRHLYHNILNLLSILRMILLNNPHPQIGGAPADNPWLQGYGSVTVGKPPEENQEAHSTPNSNRKNNEAWSEQHSTPTKHTKPAEPNSRSDRGGKSNVIPSIEVVDTEKPQGGRRTRNKPWGTQGVHGSQKASESKDEGKTDSKDAVRAEISENNASFDDMVARAEALFKTTSERFSPVPPNEGDQAGDGTFGDNNNGDWGGGNGWGDGNDAAAGDNSWGEKDAQETTTGVADPSKPTEGNSNDNSSDPAGGNASIDNVVHGDQSSNNNNNGKNDGDNGSGSTNDGNNGGNKDSKRSKAGSKRGTPTKGLPGCWVSNPPSENEDAKPPSGPDNVGPHPSGDGDGNGKKGKGKGKQKGRGKLDNNQASGSSSGNGNGNGNGNDNDGWGGVNTTWGDQDVAQSSGGVFDNDEDENNKDGKEQQGVEW
ncbi:hypothetical protein Daesc_008793 [Daldinia eschscholtzii]|uniref:Uncharacterized protein n=1 Tax=Daldinia eschscholtzii TaxID=292717 RepID=A0AAX6MCU7_9PEZI